jgi:hypothetical protein
MSDLGDELPDAADLDDAGDAGDDGAAAVAGGLAAATPNPLAADADAANPTVVEEEQQGNEPDVAPPMEWFEGGLCAALQNPGVYWALQAVLVGPTTVTMGWWIVDNGDLSERLAIGASLLNIWAMAPMLATLRDVSRPETGALALLGKFATAPGEAAPAIAAAAMASLRRWRTGVLGFALVAVILMTAVFVPMILSESFPTNAIFTVALLWLWAVTPFGVLWYLSLQLACALADAVVARTKAAASAPEAGALSDAEWATRIHDPAVLLGEGVMPTLSLWGPSLGALAVAIVAYALAQINLAVQSREPFFAAFAVGSSLMALGLLYVPASVSTECEGLLGELNGLRKRATTKVQAHISQLLSYLDASNRGQGIGFMIHGVVLSRQELKVMFAKAWTAIGALWIVLGPLLSPPVVDLGNGSTGGGTAVSFCHDGWHFSAGSCFRLFGSEDNTLEDWKTWPEAEVACQELGSNLATITSDAQNEVVRAMMADASVRSCWIGLTDVAEEGSWVWSDGEALLAEQDFKAWAGGEPSDLGPDAPQCAAFTGEDCGMMRMNGWYDHPCEFHNGETYGGTAGGEVPGQPGCYQHRIPFVCSKPATMTNHAHGGPMHGCLRSQWFAGTAHSNPDLPPTIVRVFVSAAAVTTCCCRILCLQPHPSIGV